MSKLGRQDGRLTVKQPNQNKLNKNSRLRQESQDDNGTTALFQHSPEWNKLDREYEAGCLPDEVYDRILPGWRAGLRRFLTRCLRVESEYVAKTQVSRSSLWLLFILKVEVVASVKIRIRGQFLDRYFYWTALFGSKFLLFRWSEERSLIHCDTSPYLFYGRFANVLLVRR
jgi:hypothetical protein